MSGAQQGPENLESLLDAYYQGEEAALDAIHVQLRKRLEYHSWCILHDLQEAEDAVQETFLKLAKSRTSGRFELKNVAALLYRICTNWCLDQLRRKKRHKNDVELSDEVVESHPPNLSAGLTTQDARCILDTLLASSGLTDDERMVVELRLAGVGNNEIGETMGLDPSTTSNLRRNAMNKMLRRARETPNGIFETI